MKNGGMSWEMRIRKASGEDAKRTRIVRDHRVLLSYYVEIKCVLDDGMMFYTYGESKKGGAQR